MNFVTLGKTGITVNKNGFGALPIQRISMEEAATLLQKAYQNGITFFDTARGYSDSEEKIGYALSGVRENLFIASKTTANTAVEFWAQLNTSLRLLKTDYLDIYQFHNPPVCPKPGDGTGLYEAMLEAKHRGMIHHIGLTNHRLPVAIDAVNSGLYETIQFPFSYLSADPEIELVQLCQKSDIGFIAMKALAGGLITNTEAAYAFLAQFDHVLPIWGVQRETELDEFIAFIKQPPILSDELLADIKQDSASLSGGFCRGCGYCLPCPVNIDIPIAARMSLLMRRAPTTNFLSDVWKEKMKRIDDCVRCDHCIKHCPYGLDTPKLLKENWDDYKNW